MIWSFSTYTNIWAPRLFGTLEFIESSLAQILQALSLGSTLELEAIQGLMRALSFFKGVLIPHAHGAWYGGICCLTSPKGLFLSTLKTGEKMRAEFWSGLPVAVQTLKTSSFPCILSKLFHLWKMASLNNSRILAPGKAIWKMIYIPCMMEWSKAYFDGYRGWNLKDQDTTRFTF